VNGFRTFDTGALYAALDARRLHLGLSWSGVAKQLWELSPELVKRRPDDHPFSPSTINHMKEKRQTSCQHALFMLRWLDLPPEHFLSPPMKNSIEPKLPPTGPDRNLRWSLKRLYEAVNAKRQQEGKTWAQVAATLGCTANQLTGLHTAKFATSMELAMRITQWTGRPSTDFLYLSTW
jgi:hypothetical protein